MHSTPLKLNGAWVIETEPFIDHRGLFARLFCLRELGEVIGGQVVRQINFSRTLGEGSIRGMHFQKPPSAESKFVRCVRGNVFDVIVDLRKGSSTFRQWHGEYLTGENLKMVYVPPGFAHGFQSLSNEAEMIYLHTADYIAEDEDGVRFDDPVIDIKWPLSVGEISGRDRNHALLADTFEGFLI